MSDNLPRVTYSNIGEDFSPVHAFIDKYLPDFESNVLGKQWQTDFATGESIEKLSPINKAIVLGKFNVSTIADVDNAVKSANEGANTWNKSTLEERLNFAERWQQALAKRKYELGLAALFEIGKSRMEAIGEAEECLDMVAYYASELKNNSGYQKTMNELVKNETAISIMKPYGTFAVVAPFNFPLALSVGMMSGALLTGNSVVFKPSPGCMLTGMLLAKTLKEAGLPDGVFNIVIGDDEIGKSLTSHDHIDGVVFTGSHNTGMSIFRHMATLPYMKPVIAEMGGKNPTYITAKADLDVAAQGLARSAFGLQGQKCSACSVAYVEKSVKDKLISKLVDFCSTLKVGDPRQQDVFMGPIYSSEATNRFYESVDYAKNNGQVIFGGKKIAGEDFNESYVEPTIVEMAAPSKISKQELFIPFLVIRSVDSLEEGIKEGNDINYGLSAGIYTEDETELQYFLNNAQAGVLYANRASGSTTGAWPGSQPFCGWKGTGVSGKGGLGSYFLPQFMHEQSHTLMLA